MSVGTLYAPSKQSGNGVNTFFNFSWNILAATDIVAQKIDAVGGITTGVLGVDYTVQFTAGVAGGNVIWIVPPVSGGYSLLSRASAETQLAVYQREGITPAKTTEAALDKLTLLIQEIEYRSGVNESLITTLQGQVAILQSQVAALSVSGGVVANTFANLQALAAQNPSIAFVGYATDLKQFVGYCADPTVNNGGWVVME